MLQHCNGKDQICTVHWREDRITLAAIKGKAQKLTKAGGNLPLEQFGPPHPGSHWQVLGAIHLPWTHFSAQWAVCAGCRGNRTRERKLKLNNL